MRREVLLLLYVALVYLTFRGSKLKARFVRIDSIRKNKEISLNFLTKHATVSKDFIIVPEKRNLILIEIVSSTTRNKIIKIRSFGLFAVQEIMFGTQLSNETLHHLVFTYLYVRK
jgi:hypothetical protein